MAQIGSDIRRLLRRDAGRLVAYPAPQPLEDFARAVGVDPRDVLKLDQNENPYGCSPGVIEALRTYNWYHVYPDPLHRVLRERLSLYAGAPAEQIVVGNGSDELIELILHLFVEPGDRVISAGPTFGYYATAALAVGADYHVVERGPRFEIEPERIVAAVNDRTKVCFVASPNNPTGNATPVEVIRRLLALDIVVVVDEAYFEFCGRTALDLLEAGPENLIVLRTFSKWAGLAGLRLGYGVFPASLVPVALSLKPPYSVSQAAEVAGLASLNDLVYLQSNLERILTERRRLQDGLAATGYLKPYPSDANFLLCDLVGKAAAQVQTALAARAILVRRYNSPRLENSLRISVGRPEQTDRLLTALQEIF
ncbi:MAG TPA: histidinol-phosphate transaminase [Chloroflexota bacterium]|nr:histidinol-phosphate transaminase [Chloroflexota bacterium]